MQHMIHCATKDLPISDNKLIELRKIIASDGDMQLLCQFVREGWPKHRHNVPARL